MALPNRDRWRYLHETVEDAGRGLRGAGRNSVGERLRAARGNGAAALRDLARAGDYTQGNRCAEDFQIVLVDFVLQPFLSDLVETVKLVEIYTLSLHDALPI